MLKDLCGLSLASHFSFRWFDARQTLFFTVSIFYFFLFPHYVRFFVTNGSPVQLFFHRCSKHALQVGNLGTRTFHNIGPAEIC